MESGLTTFKNILFIVGIVLSMIIPLFIAHFLFNIPAFSDYWIAKWNPGDLLNYFGSSLAFLGTIVLGGVSLYQNSKLHSINQGLMQVQYKPVITVSHTVDETNDNEKYRTFYCSVERYDARKKDSPLIDSGWSGKPTLYPYAKLSLSNIGMAPAIEVNLQWFEVKDDDMSYKLFKKYSTLDAFYSTVTLVPFTSIKENKIKRDAIQIYAEFDLGISPETNKLNLLFSFEKSAMPFLSIIEITYKDLLGNRYMKRLFLGHDGDSPYFYPISKEYKIRESISPYRKLEEKIKERERWVYR